MTESVGAPSEVDVVQISDFRLPGGTTSSIAEEVRAQSEAGLTTALIHTPSTVTSRPLPWSPQIRGILDLPGVYIASPRDHLRSQVIIIRHPTVAASTPWSFDHVRAEHVVMVVNHSAVDAAGFQFYDVEATDVRLRQMFGVAPIWAPIGPVVRQTVLNQTTKIPLREQDWLNVFRMPDTVRPRTGFVGDVPVIGRHSRPQPGKWPTTREDILAAYPDSDDYRVEILGGAEVPERILGEVPAGWNVLPFGAEHPREFVERVDFWVYFHHPDLREAFGRAAMEALAGGAVVLLPTYLRELFGDAALYGTPRDVLPLIDELYGDKDRFLAQSAKGRDFVRRFGPGEHLARLAELGIDLSSGRRAQGRIRHRAPQVDSAPTLFVAHDDDGDAALARLTTLARGDETAVFAIISTMRPKAHPANGVPYVHIPSQEAMSAPDQAWHDYLAQRVRQLVNRLRLDRIAFDGAELPQGLLAAVEGRPTGLVWMKDGKGQDDLRLT